MAKLADTKKSEPVKRSRSFMDWFLHGLTVFLGGFLAIIIFSAVFFTLLPRLNYAGYHMAASQGEDMFWSYFVLPFGAADVLFLYGGIRFIGFVFKKLFAFSSWATESYEERKARKGDN